MKSHATATTAIAMLAAAVLVAACSNGHHTSTPVSTTRAPTRSAPPPTATTTTVRPAAQRLLTALRSDRFDGSGLAAHLHVVGVGRWQYADAGHEGSSYLGSAEVSLRSNDAGETISGIYDVFTVSAGASASFAQARSNFRNYSPAGSFRIVKLDPAVGAFCGPQAAPANTTTCWFVHASTTGLITATIPSVRDAGDSQAVLESMLMHLVALGG